MAGDTRAESVDRNRIRQESSVRHLQGLYTIVAGLALSDGITTLFGIDDRGWRNPLAVTLLLAFMVTLVPFVHGALRHFDDTYLVPGGPLRIGRASLAVDFGFLFLQSVLLFMLAHQLDHVIGFAVLLGLLLLVDIAWVVAISGASPDGRRFGQELRTIVRRPRVSVLAQQHWARNNVRHLLLLVVFVATARWLFPDREVMQGAVVLTVALSRTVFDYLGSWEFYFPEVDPE